MKLTNRGRTWAAVALVAATLGLTLAVGAAALSDGSGVLGGSLTLAETVELDLQAVESGDLDHGYASDPDCAGVDITAERRAQDTAMAASGDFAVVDTKVTGSTGVATIAISAPWTDGPLYVTSDWHLTASGAWAQDSDGSC